MSKKVKGQKLDLAAFNGPAGGGDSILSRLPSAPDPTRE